MGMFKNIFGIHRVGWVILSISICLGACNKSADYNRVPLSVPFGVAKAGSNASMDFVIDEKKFYAVTLQYSFDEKNSSDRRRVWNLAGGSEEIGAGEWAEPGAPLEIHVEIFRVTNGSKEKISTTQATNPRLSSWGAETLNAQLLSAKLEPGAYQVKVENLKNASQFNDVKTHISVTQAYMGK
jgi:hypothetical protein